MAVAGYVIFQSPQPSNNTSNNQNVANNTTQNNTPTNQTNYIGKAQAKKITRDFLEERGVTDYEIRTIDLVTVNGVTLYRVGYWDYYITADGTESGWDDLYIGAVNGKIYDSYGNLANDV